MSWQSYVDEKLIATKMVQHGAIIGHEGNIWAKSKDFKVSECLFLITIYNIFLFLFLLLFLFFVLYECKVEFWHFG